MIYALYIEQKITIFALYTKHVCGYYWLSVICS